MSDTGIEPATSSVSGKRATAAPIAQTQVQLYQFNKVNEKTHYTRADDEIRTRDPNLGKVVRYQLRHIRLARFRAPE